MEYKGKQEKEIVGTEDFYTDFSNLSKKEKRFILKTVETLVKVQQENNTMLNPSQIGE